MQDERRAGVVDDGAFDHYAHLRQQQAALNQPMDGPFSGTARMPVVADQPVHQAMRQDDALAVRRFGRSIAGPLRSWHCRQLPLAAARGRAPAQARSRPAKSSNANPRSTPAGARDSRVLLGSPSETRINFFRGGSYTTLSVPGASSTTPQGINDGGEIVGSYYVNDPLHVKSFLYSNGSFNSIDVPGSLATDAWAINNKGHIVGDYRDGSGAVHALLYTLTGYTRHSTSLSRLSRSMTPTRSSVFPTTG